MSSLQKYMLEQGLGDKLEAVYVDPLYREAVREELDEIISSTLAKVNVTVDTDRFREQYLPRLEHLIEVRAELEGISHRQRIVSVDDIENVYIRSTLVRMSFQDKSLPDLLMTRAEVEQTSELLVPSAFRVGNLEVSFLSDFETSRNWLSVMRELDEEVEGREVMFRVASAFSEDADVDEVLADYGLWVGFQVRTGEGRLIDPARISPLAYLQELVTHTKISRDLAVEFLAQYLPKTNAEDLYDKYMK